MSNYAKIENLEGYIKDLRTGAIILQDKEIEKKQKNAVEKEMRTQLQINELKSEMREIKELLKRIINNG